MMMIIIIIIIFVIIITLDSQIQVDIKNLSI
jgi:hypothetical protein